MTSEVLEKFFDLSKFFSIFLGVYTTIFILSLIISLWNIFKKEKIKPYFSLIPFLNIYNYYKICGLPFWTFFIPIINILVLYFASYVIAKKYNCSPIQRYLAIFFPFIILPYIAFSNKRNIYLAIDNVYLKNANDVDILENKLVSDISELDYVSPDSTVVVNSDNKDIMPNIDNEDLIDEFIYDEIEEIKETDYVEPDNDEFIELKEDMDINNLNMKNMEELEENMEIAASAEKKLETNIKDYKEQGPSSEAIAFGGKKKTENVNDMQAKNDELKCSRCGTSLVGAINNTCPGCGILIEYEK